MRVAPAVMRGCGATLEDPLQGRWGQGHGRDADGSGRSGDATVPGRSRSFNGLTLRARRGRRTRSGHSTRMAPGKEVMAPNVTEEPGLRSGHPRSRWRRHRRGQGHARDADGSGRSGDSTVPGRSRPFNGLTLRARRGRRTRSGPGSPRAVDNSGTAIRWRWVPATCGPTRRPALQFQHRCSRCRRLEASAREGVNRESSDRSGISGVSVSPLLTF
jgi:hypothetical protein